MKSLIFDKEKEYFKILDRLKNTNFGNIKVKESELEKAANLLADNVNDYYNRRSPLPGSEEEALIIIDKLKGISDNLSFNVSINLDNNYVLNVTWVKYESQTAT